MAIQSSPMASLTRSTRRANAEGLHPHSLHHPHPVPVQQQPTHQHQQAFAANTVTRAAPQNISAYHHQLPGRTKRQLDTADLVDFDQPKQKRSRSSIEILIKPAPQPVKPVVANATAAHNVTTTPTPQPTTTTPQATPLARPTPKPAQQHVATVHPLKAPSTPATDNAPQLTKHQEKVINGIKHELDRLQPREADTHTKEGGRKLRSQEATRFKSELSAYFPEYDEVIGNDPKEQHLLNVDTPIVIFDSNPTRLQPAPWLPFTGAEPSVPKDASTIPPSAHKVPVRGYGDALFSDLVDAQRIDFDFLGISHKREPAEDPLPDASFVPSHKRAERLEKSIRNTERGRAQHEKDQIARLLGGLQGHDWLRVMGVSGITESRKKQYEPARQHFMKGCQAILERFRQWSLEEKRRKAEKDRALAKAEAEETSDEDSSEGSDEDDAEEDDAGNVSDGDPPGSSDDDSVSQQLHEEAIARSKGAKNKIPEIDFDLPEEFRDEETLKMQARKRRRDRRGRH
ncbi:hypothetical protein K4K52_001099 [Colletotrichum sp. SAR 10_76]|nr:hypothetical protein K4K52_001099 [Colletotrichum sp. SAR 10_76]